MVSGLSPEAEVQLKLLTGGLSSLPYWSSLILSPVTSRRGQSCNHVKPSRLQGLQKRPINFDLQGTAQFVNSFPGIHMPLPYRLSKHATVTLQRTPPYPVLSSLRAPVTASAKRKGGNIRSPPVLPVDYKSRQSWRYAGAQSSTCLLLEKCVTGARGAPWDHMVPAPVPRAAREPWVAGACAEPSVPGKKAGAKGG